MVRLNRTISMNQNIEGTIIMPTNENVMREKGIKQNVQCNFQNIQHNFNLNKGLSAYEIMHQVWIAKHLNHSEDVAEIDIE